MAVNVYDRWHKSRPKPYEPTCKEHNLVPSSVHLKGERWQVRWDVWVEGKRQQPKRNFPKKVGKDPEIHADAFVTKIQAELDASKHKPLADCKRLTIKEVGAEWLKSLDADDTTIYTIERRAENHILTDEFGETLVWDVYRDPNIVQQWIKGLRASGHAQNYIRAIALHLSSMFSYAAHKEYLPANPIKGNPLVKIPGRSRRIVMPYTTDQLNAITENLRPKYQIVTKTGAGLGLRIGEIFGLSPDDIHGNEIHVQRQVKVLHRTNTVVFALPKGGKTRIVPLPDSVAEYLAELPTCLVTYPWVRPDGKPVTVRLYMARKQRGFGLKATTNAWNAAFVKAGMTRVPRVDTFHKLRHTYASVLLKAGVDIRTLAQYLGHDDPGFTLRTYCHFMQGSGEVARKAIDG